MLRTSFFFLSLVKIENRSLFLPIRQVYHTTTDSWKLLFPDAAASFLWEDFGRPRLLEFLVEGTESLESLKYNIDELLEHQPKHAVGHQNNIDGIQSLSFLWEDFGRPRLLEFLVEGTDSLESLKYNIDELLEHQPKHAVGHPARALRVTILKEGKMNIVRISDWMPENEPSLITGRRVQPPSPQPSGNVSPQQQLPSSTGCKFHVVLELAVLGTSVTEHTPR